MLKKPEEFKVKDFENFHGGNGTLHAKYLFDEEITNKKIRMACMCELEPGSSIGPHPHEKDEEIIYVLEGTITINDSGEIKEAHAGDAAICGNGGFHGVSNLSDKPAKYLAFIILY